MQRREENVIADVAACAVGAMTSLLLLVIMYTLGKNERRKHRQNDQSLNLLQCSLRSHLVEIIIVRLSWSMLLIHQAVDYNLGKTSTPSDETPQRILLKFGLNCFQVSVILPSNFGSEQPSGFKGEA